MGTCGNFAKKGRSRTCNNGVAGTDCMGDADDSVKCEGLPACETYSFGDWADWGSCSVTCGDGEMIRARKCNTYDQNFAVKESDVNATLCDANRRRRKRAKKKNALSVT